MNDHFDDSSRQVMLRPSIESKQRRKMLRKNNNLVLPLDFTFPLLSSMPDQVLHLETFFVLPRKQNRKPVHEEPYEHELRRCRSNRVELSGNGEYMDLSIDTKI